MELVKTLLNSEFFITSPLWKPAILQEPEHVPMQSAGAPGPPAGPPLPLRGFNTGLTLQNLYLLKQLAC